ncbi:sulfur carrier protein ThiS [Dyadobacter sp. CY261]|uniref:sulfur carrier protein ThiS n=1 Tax=Dyadobacter sp. CY261 TaxID=2907203 RepID=UPI001F199C22|nr:sulfur carrier protein ThiS [Dyadobacter sp. CY261]MCF0070685.1 sulfur carrier protein ThiS [Dyadobacter sp. CY261]
MEITINGKPSQIAASYTVGQLVSELFSACGGGPANSIPGQATSGKGIAVAINQSVVPKSDWHTRQLSPNDQITLITATQGG